MKRLRIITLICLILSAVLMAAATVSARLRQDDTLPEIRCPEEPLVIAMAEAEDDRLLRDVTAWDEKDGDLTGRVLVQSVEKTVGGSTASVTYAVSDSDNHVATCTREVQYTDYQPPRFALSRELRYPVGSTVRVKDRLTAWDALDGDLSDRIRVISSNTNTAAQGSYPVTFEVTNSLGDTASLTLEIQVKNQEAGEPEIRLSQYLVYRKQTDDFRAMDYVESVSGGSEEDVAVQMPEGGLTAGVSRVEYRCAGSGGAVGTAVLYVVTE